MSEQALHSINPKAVTPEHDLYSEKDDGTKDHVPDADDLVVTPDTQDNYVGDEVNLSFGGRCALVPLRNELDTPKESYSILENRIQS